jgi:putative transposase
MDGKGRALDNIFIERFWRTIKFDKINIVVPKDGLVYLKLVRNLLRTTIMKDLMNRLIISSL